MLKLTNISYSWADRDALRDISLQLNGGEIVALLGPNGAGKSTLVRNILGQLIPQKGVIEFQGKILSAASEQRSSIAWVPQAITLYPQLSVAENLKVFARIMGVASQQLAAQLEKTLALVGLSARRKELAGNLSGGMQRMLNVGIALVANPQLLILDEPTAGIDQKARQQLHKTLLALKDQGLAIMLTTHDLEDARRLADRVAILAEGELLAEGGAADLIKQRFANQREVRVRWPEDQDNPDWEALLKSAALHETRSGSWHGLLANNDGKLDGLLKTLLLEADAAPDVTVREPGLDMLIHSLISKREAS